MANQVIQIRAVAFKEGEIYVAQGLEFDICVQAKALSDLPKKFAYSVAANVAISLELGKQPLEGIRPAPQQFFDMFDAAQLTLTHPSSSIDEAMPLPAIQSTVRWSDLAHAA